MSDATLAAQAGIPVAVMRAIKAIESSGNPRAVRFETRLFARDAGITVEGHSRDAFERAFAIDPERAVTSTSWGLYQVLGRPLITLYGSPAAGVRAFDANPRDVSDRLLVEWFKSRPAARAAANNGDYRELARLYNGSSTSPWYGRFMEALGAAGGVGGAGLTLAAAAGFAAWFYFRGRR